MKFTPTGLPAVVLVEPKVFEEERGSFMETWEGQKLAVAGLEARFVQDNHSVSRQWVLRGLHFQLRRPAHSVRDKRETLELHVEHAATG